MSNAVAPFATARFWIVSVKCTVCPRSGVLSSTAFVTLSCGSVTVAVTVDGGVGGTPVPVPVMLFVSGVPPVFAGTSATVAW